MKLTSDQLKHLQSLENDGRLTPEQVVDAARPADSPLHELFEWNDADAAGRFRLDQARTVIREVEVRIVRRNVVVDAPRYVHDPGLENRRAGYVSVSELANQPAMAREVVRTELGRALAYLNRAHRVAVALHDVPEIGTAITLLSNAKTALELGIDDESTPVAVAG